MQAKIKATNNTGAKSHGGVPVLKDGMTHELAEWNSSRTSLLEDTVLSVPVIRPVRQVRSACVS